MHKEIPCGGSNDCEAVANDPSSMIGGVPVALIGLLAYVIFAAFGLARAFGGVVKLRKLTVIGFGLSIVGLLESTSLTIYSLTKIQATCKWCIASAITMALLMVAQAWLAQETKQEEQDTDTAMVPSLIAIVAFGLLGFQASQLARAATINPISRDIIERTPLAELVPPDAPFIGNANAPVTIVEFGDVRCPACRTSWSKMKERVKNAQGNIKWVFRHFPFFEKVEHRLSVPAAVLSYYCAPTGGFFPYVESCFSADRPVSG